MQKNRKNTKWADKANQEQIHIKESAFERSPVGKLISHNALRYIPSEEQASEKSANGQEYLSCHKVEDVKKRFSKELKIIYVSQRQ